MKNDAARTNGESRATSEVAFKPQVANFRNGQLYVDGVKVPYIPCNACKDKESASATFGKSLGVRVLGTGFNAAVLPCRKCLGTGKLRNEDIIRNQRLNAQRISEARQQAQAEDYDKVLATAAGK